MCWIFESAKIYKIMCSNRHNGKLTCAFRALVTLLLSICLLFPALPFTSHLFCVYMCMSERERARVCVCGRNCVFVVQHIIHVLSGQQHLANAALLSLLAGVDHLGASAKWTVNIDGEMARVERRPCQEEKQGRRGRGNDWGAGRKRAGWRERERQKEEMEMPSPKATECALMHCGREHTVSPERESISLTHTQNTHTMQSYHINHDTAF